MTRSSPLTTAWSNGRPPAPSKLNPASYPMPLARMRGSLRGWWCCSVRYVPYTTEVAEQPRAARRRGAELEHAILRAAAEELTESGYAGLTMDRVARRAGTNKNTIYRRWPNRAALGIAAYHTLAVAALRVPDTGELRADVLELLRAANRTWSSPIGGILR